MMRRLLNIAGILCFFELELSSIVIHEEPLPDNDIHSSCDCTLRGDTVSMLTHIYPHKPLRKTEVTICNHQADSHFVCDLMSDLVICKFWKSMVIHDAECPHWGQVSLNNTNQIFVWLRNFCQFWPMLHILMIMTSDLNWSNIPVSNWGRPLAHLVARWAAE